MLPYCAFADAAAAHGRLGQKVNRRRSGHRLLGKVHRRGRQQRDGQLHKKSWWSRILEIYPGGRSDCCRWERSVSWGRIPARWSGRRDELPQDRNKPPGGNRLARANV